MQTILTLIGGYLLVVFPNIWNGITLNSTLIKQDSINSYAPKPGFYYKYQIHFTNVSKYYGFDNYSLNSAKQENVFGFNLDGILTFCVSDFKINENSIIVSFSDLKVTLTLNGIPQTKEIDVYLSDLQSPSLWEFYDNGKLKTIWRDTVRSDIGNNLLRLIASCIQTVIYSDHLSKGDSWTVTESNLNGALSMNYQVDREHIIGRKNKRRNLYFVIRKSPGNYINTYVNQTDQFITKNVNSTKSTGEIQIYYDSTLKQIREIYGELIDSIKLGAFNFGSSKINFNVTYNGSKKNISKNLPVNMKFNYELPISPLMEPIDQKSRAKRFLKGETINQLISELRLCDIKSDAGQRANLHSKVLAFLQLDPVFSDTIVNVLKINPPTSYSFKITLSAFIVSGSERAQIHLGELLKDITYSKESKLSILINVAELKQPTITLIEALKSISLKEDHNFILLVNITLAKLITNISSSNLKIANDFIKTFNDRSSELIDRFGTRDFLKMIPKINSQYLIPTILDTYQKSNIIEKNELIKLLSEIQGNVSDSLLYTIAKSESDLNIRANSLNMLNNRNLSETIVVSIIAIAQHDESPDIRAQALRIIDKYKNRYEAVKIFLKTKND